jgi:hypothetical protein
MVVDGSIGACVSGCVYAVVRLLWGLATGVEAAELCIAYGVFEWERMFCVSSVGF